MVMMGSGIHNAWLRQTALAVVLLLAAWLAAPGCALTESSSESGATVQQEVCLWLLWVQGRTLEGEVVQALADGEHFMEVARRLTRRNPKTAVLHSQCAQGAKLEPAVLNAAKGLELGQVSSGFPLRDGTAFVFRTTDEYRKQGQDLFKQRLYRQAEEMLRKDLKLHPTSGASWHLLARCRAALGDVNDAVNAFAKAAAYDPANPVHHFYKGLAHEELRQDQEALAEFRTALKLDPENLVLMSNLARALADSGKDLDEAEALARKVLETQPENPEAWVALAKAQRARGQHAQAAVSFHKALSLRPQDPVTRQDFLDAMLAVDSGMMHKLEGGGAPLAAPPKEKQPAPPAPRLDRERQKADKKPVAESAKPVRIEKPAPPLVAEAPVPPPARPKAAAPSSTQPRNIKAQLDAPAAPPSPSPSLTASSATVGPDAARHYIQVGSYPDEALAKAEVLKWKALGMSGRLERFQLPGGPVELLLLLGPYASREKAREEGLRLKKMNAIQFFMVVERDPDQPVKP